MMRREIAIIYIIQQQGIDPGEENVHDTNVRGELWRKYKRMVHEATSEPKTYEATSFLYKHFPGFVNSQIVDDVGQLHWELDIFIAVYTQFVGAGLDLEILRATVAESAEVCVAGRVARYIAVFEGLVPGYLGETELTREIAFQMALARCKVLFDGYASGNIEQTEEWLLETQKKIIADLRSEFKMLSTKDLTEISSAIL